MLGPNPPSARQGRPKHEPTATRKDSTPSERFATNSVKLAVVVPPSCPRICDFESTAPKHLAPDWSARTKPLVRRTLRKPGSKFGFSYLHSSRHYPRPALIDVAKSPYTIAMGSYKKLSVGVKELKDGASEIIALVQRTGQAVSITKNHREGARIMPRTGRRSRASDRCRSCPTL